MNLEDFTDALNELGIAWAEKGQSLVLQNCPECGSQKWKVHLRLDRPKQEDPFFGRCYSGKCETNYSSVKYLLSAGMEYPDVMRVHGRDPDSNLRNLTVNVDELMELTKDSLGKPTVALDLMPEVSLAKFVNIADWPSHPASVYARSRGVPPEFYDRVLIDPETNAVVFVAREGETVVGFQRRFINPSSPETKTKSSFGFQKTEHLMHFPRDNAKIVVCEGPFTAISAWYFGYYAVCTFGSGVSKKQVKLIAELSEKIKQPVGVAFDMDEAGKKGFDAIRNGMFWREQDVFVVEASPSDGLPKGFDLNDAWRNGLGVKEVVSNWGGPAIPDISGFL